jgi:hypothetical protein
VTALPALRQLVADLRDQGVALEGLARAIEVLGRNIVTVEQKVADVRAAADQLGRDVHAVAQDVDDHEDRLVELEYLAHPSE